jgi:hypothetical protein
MSRRKLVTKEPELPLALVNRNSRLADAIDEVSAAHCAGLKLPVLLDHTRSEIKAMCALYQPAPADDLTIFPDGKDIMCVSGCAGHAMLRGKICSKICLAGNPETDKSELKGLIVRHGIDAVQAALEAQFAETSTQPAA